MGKERKKVKKEVGRREGRKRKISLAQHKLDSSCLTYEQEVTTTGRRTPVNGDISVPQA